MLYVRPFKSDEPAATGEPEWLIAPEEAAECSMRIRRTTRDAGQLAPSPNERFLFVLSGSAQLAAGNVLATAGPAELIFVPPGATASLRCEARSVWIEIEAALPKGTRGPANPAPSVVKLDRTKFEGGGFSWQVMADRRMGAQSLRLNVVKVQPGSGSPDFHIHAFGQAYLIQEGTMTIDIGREKYQATANTLVYLPAGVVHRNYNASNAVEQHMSLLMPEPAPGEVFDYAVTIHEHEAKMLTELPA